MSALTNYNPDVLSCLANLSNDEVFTPPEVANAMLDLLPQELFRDPDATFLDPACKSGVFLREIAKRLLVGLQSKIPDLQERVDHIFHRQLYGIAITELTALLSRRSVYCSKTPSGKYSVSRFPTKEGNIRFRETKHRWNGDKCVFCGAGKSQFGDDLRTGLESHAYEFIHLDNPEKLFSMKFDVIIGNPPYQLTDGGNAASAIPIYQKFVDQSKKLAPRFLVMITPSRWFTGGRGLDKFRDEMLHDRSIRVIHDYVNADDCFPGVEIKGGVSYFLWNRDQKGQCNVITHTSDGKSATSMRELLEPGMNSFVRYKEQVSVLKKVQLLKEPPFSDIVSPNDPFGYDLRIEGSYKRIKPSFSLKEKTGFIRFYYNGWRKEGVGFIDPSTVRKNNAWINKFKVLIPQAWGSGDPLTDWISPFVVSPGCSCSETYMVVGPFKSKKESENAISYMQTKFFHFLVGVIKITQHATQGMYSIVPMQDFSKPWTDEELYAKYKLTKDEIAFIESMIKPMGDEAEAGE